MTIRFQEGRKQDARRINFCTAKIFLLETFFDFSIFFANREEVLALS